MSRSRRPEPEEFTAGIATAGQAQRGAAHGSDAGSTFADPVGQAELLSAEAAELGLAGDHDGRVLRLERVLEIRRDTLGPRSSAVADTLDEIARAFCAGGRFNAARARAQQSLEIRQSVFGPHHPETARSLDRLGEVEFGTNDVNAAAALYRRALAIRRKRLDPSDPLIANSLNNLACIHARRGDAARACRMFEQVLLIKMRALGEDAPDLIVLLENVAVMHRGLGRFEKARQRSQRALVIAEASYGAEHPYVAEMLASLADSYVGLGQYDEAYHAAERALRIRRAALGEDHPATAIAKLSIGIVLGHAGASDRARVLFEQAVHVLREVAGTPNGDPTLALALYHLGLTCAELNQRDRARDLLAEALTLYRASRLDREAAMVLHNIGVLERVLRNHGGAIDSLDYALRHQRQMLGDVNRDVGMTLLEIARNRDALGERRAAMRAAAEGLGVLLRCDDPEALAWAYDTMAAIVVGKCRSAGIFFGKLAVNMMQRLRSRVAGLGTRLEREFLQLRETRYRALADLLIISGRLPEAQQVLTMLKEAELFEISRGTSDPRGTLSTLTPFEANCRRRIEWLQRKLARSHGAAPKTRASRPNRRAIALVEVESIIADLIDKFSATERSRKPARVANMGAWKPPYPDVAMLQYVLSPDHMRIVVSVAGLQRDYRIDLPETELHRLVFEMRAGITERATNVLENARRLHDLLIGPAAEILHSSGVRRLMLSLDGVLRYLPVAALHDGSRYLVENFALVVTSGAANRERRGKPTVLRGVGLGQSREIAGHSALHGVREELNSVIRTKNGRGIVPGIIRLDEDFSATALRQAISGAFSVVHLASHFSFAAGHEAASYLLLGDGTKVTLGEFSNMSLRGIDLVTLSACDTATGAGHRHSGREIEGLGALVRRQGARKVVATLWPVADLTTATLMGTFYRNMYGDGHDAAEALRLAQVALLRSDMHPTGAAAVRGLIDPDDLTIEPENASRHPYFWAPFILMGSVATLQPSEMSAPSKRSSRARRPT